jgi:hypothetical protein
MLSERLTLVRNDVDKRFPHDKSGIGHRASFNDVAH